MLNRTNRTLSANLNGLNLGTRSLDLVECGINGGQTLRARQVYDLVMRDGRVWSHMIPDGIHRRIPAIPHLPSLFSASPSAFQRWVSAADVQLTATVPSASGQSRLHGSRRESTCFSGAERLLSRSQGSQGPAKCKRPPVTGERLQWATGKPGTQARASQSAVAAIQAASGR